MHFFSFPDREGSGSELQVVGEVYGTALGGVISARVPEHRSLTVRDRRGTKIHESSACNTGRVIRKFVSTSSPGTSLTADASRYPDSTDPGVDHLCAAG